MPDKVTYINNQKTYFNWHQILRDSNNDACAILLLTYALNIGYNNKITSSTKDLLKYLHIDSIPIQLFEQGHFVVTSDNSIFSRYKCDEPQSYYYNPFFAIAKIDVTYKTLYIWALAQRRISQRENFIPDTHIQETQWSNPLLRHKDNKLYFIPEMALFKTKNKFRT